MPSASDDLRPLDERDIDVWRLSWGDVANRLRTAFARSESRESAMAYLGGLLSPAERKNGWQLAEIIGHPNPYRVQELLSRALWDPDELRDRLRRSVLDYLGDPDAIGVLDETGFLKKGAKSVGVARQYCGAAGRVENCQVGVLLTYASAHGQTLLDRELRQWLEARHQPYVVAISSTEHLWLGHESWSLADLSARLATRPWERLRCGAGSQGPRWYDWQRVRLNDPAEPGWRRWLVLRRSCTDPTEVRAYRAYGPEATPLDTQVRVIGKRWTVEESIQTGKSEVGLDECEVRSWTGWYRHITLAMWAHAFLSVLRHQEGAVEAPKKGGLQTAGARSLARFTARRGLRCG